MLLNVVITFCLGCHLPDNNLQNIVWLEGRDKLLAPASLDKVGGGETLILIDCSYDMHVTTDIVPVPGTFHITAREVDVI